MPATDLVVVLPGIMGSTLTQNGKPVWAPSAGSVLRAIRTFGTSITALQLPDDLGDEHPGDNVQATALMPDLHLLPGIWTPVKGYDRLLARLRALGYHPSSGKDAPPANLLPLPYDWRLSNRYNARALAGTIEDALERLQSRGGPYADAKVVFVCHSMGGLVARWYIEHCGGASITRKLITLGTPYRGAAKALDQLLNGVHPGIGRLGIDLTDFARSLPSIHQLLPEYACIQRSSTEPLLKTTETSLPDLSSTRLADAMRFHTDLFAAEKARPASGPMTHAILGIGHNTPTTLRLTDKGAELLDTLGPDNHYGDGTVPLVAAARPDVLMDSNQLRRVPDKHGNLQRNPAALDELEGILTAKSISVRNPHQITPNVDTPDLVLASQALSVDITLPSDTHHPVLITLTDENEHPLDTRMPPLTRGHITTAFDGLPPGAYHVVVTGPDATSPLAPITSTTLVWE